ncbi:putative transmembrane ATP-binding protein ABC transporter [Mycobacterium intracellulare]|nr:putative transmembrane ATP-binding protein ABC transporter [Mycobacterium intracellulare]
MLLRPRLPRVLAAITLGVLSLGSALALAGVAAWLITRAWQMPPVLDLSVAAVAVRLFAISRAVLHYCERLVTHDTALRAAGTARVQVYQRLARGPAAAAVRLHSGELVSGWGPTSTSWPTSWCAPWFRSASRRCWRSRPPRSSPPFRRRRPSCSPSACSSPVSSPLASPGGPPRPRRRSRGSSIPSATPRRSSRSNTRPSFASPACSRRHRRIATPAPRLG